MNPPTYVYVAAVERPSTVDTKYIASLGDAYGPFHDWGAPAHDAIHAAADLHLHKGKDFMTDKDVYWDFVGLRLYRTPLAENSLAREFL